MWSPPSAKPVRDASLRVLSFALNLTHTLTVNSDQICQVTMVGLSLHFKVI